MLIRQTFVIVCLHKPSAIVLQEINLSAEALQAVITDMGQRAHAAGYQPRRAIERMSFGSFVSTANRYFYMETPKAACTSFKHFIAGIEGIAPDASAAPYQRETRPDMRIHERRHLAMPTLLNAPAAARAAILGRAPGWMSFAIVRNPFSRLVSFFEHKVRMGEPGYGAMEARYGEVSVFGGLKPAFLRFVEEVVADPAIRQTDSHLMPQVQLLMPRLIPYTHVFPLERVGDAVAALSAHLGGRPLSLPRAPSAGRDWRAYYDASSAQMVAAIFAEDFALFGYDPADWLQGREAPVVNEEFWRREVVARNAMIQLLYDRLGTPPANSFVEKSKKP
jgi:hypothetical protein